MSLFIHRIHQIPVLSCPFELVEIKINDEILDVFCDTILLIDLSELQNLFARLREFRNTPLRVIHKEKHELVSVVLDTVCKGRDLVEWVHDGQKCVVIIDGVVKLDVKFDSYHEPVRLL